MYYVAVNMSLSDVDVQDFSKKVLKIQQQKA